MRIRWLQTNYRKAFADLLPIPSSWRRFCDNALQHKRYCIVNIGKSVNIYNNTAALYLQRKPFTLLLLPCKLTWCKPRLHSTAYKAFIRKCFLVLKLFWNAYTNSCSHQVVCVCVRFCGQYAQLCISISAYTYMHSTNTLFCSINLLFSRLGAFLLLTYWLRRYSQCIVRVFYHWYCNATEQFVWYCFNYTWCHFLYYQYTPINTQVTGM